MRNLLKQDAQPQGDSTTTFIYGLVDPVTGYVRYIGKADDPTIRLQRHFCRRELSARSHKAHWLRELAAKGLRPGIIIIEKVSKSEWQEAERRWIAHYRSVLGHDVITNTTSGGDGIDKGTKFSEETRKKMGDSRRGRPIPPEVIAKRAAKRKGKKFTQEQRERLSAAHKITWQNFSEEEKQKRLKNLRPKIKKEKPPQPPKIKKTHRVYPDKSNCSSRFRGVSYYRVGKPWHAFCSFNGKLRHLGCFNIEEEAARAFDRFVVENNILDAQTNFPLSNYPDIAIPPPQ